MSFASGADPTPPRGAICAHPVTPSTIIRTAISSAIFTSLRFCPPIIERSPASRRQHSWNRGEMSNKAARWVMYESVCKFGGEKGNGNKMAFTFGRGQTIERWLRVRPRSFFDWEKTEGVLTPELCDQHKHEEGTPMLLEQATLRNVSRAMGEINGFEWEGDFKPMARQALKELLEK